MAKSKKFYSKNNKIKDGRKSSKHSEFKNKNEKSNSLKNNKKTTENISQHLKQVIKIANSNTNNMKNSKQQLDQQGHLDTKTSLSNKDFSKSLQSEISKELLNKFSRGEGIKGTGIKTNLEKIKLLKNDKMVTWATEQTARTTILLTENSGGNPELDDVAEQLHEAIISCRHLHCSLPHELCEVVVEVSLKFKFIEPDENEVTRQYTQEQISQNVDITSAAKKFELKLECGPYRMNYSKNGRFLLLGGRRGHVAALDWVTKTLMSETNVMEEVFDVQWLHQETMFAVAQKDWVYVYDNQGVEMHCIKSLHKVIRLEFLPYHFLLCTGNEDGFLGWLDMSIGKIVNNFNTRQGRLKVMTQNPSNAVICLGHTNGIVTMWSPTVRDPLVKMLCHKQPITSIAVNNAGLYMVTAAVDRSIKVWDVRRMSGPLQDYRMHSVVSNVAFSQRNVVATSSGNIVETYNDFCTKGEGTKHPYLRQKLYKTVENLQFCPYEDILGVGTYNGFTSLLVPGSGEPNFDAFEANPFQSKSQRREAEVKGLLEKIQPEMITLDPTVITEVDVPSLKDKLEAKKSLLFLKPPKIDFTPRKKSKRQGKTVKMAKTKKIMKEQHKREFISALKAVNIVEEEEKPNESTKDVLNRFNPSSKKKMCK